MIRLKMNSDMKWNQSKAAVITPMIMQHSWHQHRSRSRRWITRCFFHEASFTHLSIYKTSFLSSVRLLAEGCLTSGHGQLKRSCYKYVFFPHHHATWFVLCARQLGAVLVQVYKENCHSWKLLLQQYQCKFCKKTPELERSFNNCKTIIYN